MQISNNNPTNPPPPHTTSDRTKEDHTQTKQQPHHPHHPSPRGTHAEDRPPTPQDRSGLMLQDPTVCSTLPPPDQDPVPHPHPASQSGSTRTPAPTRDQASSTIPLVNTTMRPPHDPSGQPESGRVLLRKEVIQPHLPVRLPCYDFVPIASPTFDGSLHKGWATGFGCCRLS